MGPWFWHRLPSCTCSRWHLRVPSYHLQSKQAALQILPSSTLGKPGGIQFCAGGRFFFVVWRFQSTLDMLTNMTYQHDIFSESVASFHRGHPWISWTFLMVAKSPDVAMNPSGNWPVNPNTLAQRRPHMLWVWSLGRNPKKSGKMTSFHIHIYIYTYIYIYIYHIYTYIYISYISLVHGSSGSWISIRSFKRAGDHQIKRDSTGLNVSKGWVPGHGERGKRKILRKVLQNTKALANRTKRHSTTDP